MAKKVWISWIAAEKAAFSPPQVVQSLQKNGLEVSGDNWIDDLEKMAWTSLSEVLLDKEKADIWLIAIDQANLDKPSNRYALSLLTAMVREQRGPEFPIVMLGLGFSVSTEALPTLLRSFNLLTSNDAGWSAKVVAAAFSKTTPAQSDYRFSVRANPMFGQWFEIGPAKESWDGVMFGVSDEGKIVLHAVGPKNVVPERTVLEYQIKDMKAKVADIDFTVWSVQNKLGEEDSYYVKVEGFPEKIIFSGNSGTDQAEVYVITLK